MSPLVLAMTSTAAEDPDLALVHAMADGDVDAHRILYERHGRGVLAFIAARVGDAGAAEELLHDVMLAAWNGAAGFRGRSRVKTWLLVIAHNRVCNELRRRVRLDIVPAPEAVAGARDGVAKGRPGALDEQIDLAAAIDRLPAGQREVLDLVFAQGLGQEEAADVLGVAVGTVKSRLNRAKAQLREHLQDADGAHGGHDV